jgi:hypothetical protein
MSTTEPTGIPGSNYGASSMTADSKATERMVAASLDPCLEKREDDEPMFILLARDSVAPRVLEVWCHEREVEIGSGVRPNTPEEQQHIAQVRAKADAFRAWRLDNR